MLIKTCMLGELSHLILQGSCQPQICATAQEMWLLQHTSTSGCCWTHTPLPGLFLGGRRDLVSDPSEQLQQPNLPPKGSKSGAMAVLSIPLLCPAPADLIHRDEGSKSGLPLHIHMALITGQLGFLPAATALLP